MNLNGFILKRTIGQLVLRATLFTVLGDSEEAEKGEQGDV